MTSNPDLICTHKHAQHIQKCLIAWQTTHGRNNLPWQCTDPYTTWISEIMLQQTQVASMTPYFLKFIKSFPTVIALANANLDDILAHWSGLGYYRRAHNLYYAARLWKDNFQNSEPVTLEDWMTLPGIGRSTAGAIMSLSQGRKQPLCDSNAKRVFSRYFGPAFIAMKEKKRWDFLYTILPDHNIRRFNQGLMDLGAMICTKNNPKCHICPIAQKCAQYEEPTQTKNKTKIKTSIDLHVSFSISNNHIALTQSNQNSIWPSLWFLPEIIPNKHHDYYFIHELTHRQMHVYVYLQDSHDHTYTHVNIATLHEIAHPSLLKKIINKIHTKTVS